MPKHRSNQTETDTSPDCSPRFLDERLCGIHPDLPHIAHFVMPVPEGIAICVRCNQCGGRAEALVEPRRRARPDDAKATVVSMNDVDAALYRLLLPFCGAHSQCVKRPLEFTLPEPIQKVMENRLKLAEDLLTDEGPIASTITLLLEDGTELVSAMPHIPSQKIGKRAERDLSSQIAHVLFRLREAARAASSPVLGAVLVAEYDVIVSGFGKTARRRSRGTVARGIGATIATPSFAHNYFAPIIQHEWDGKCAYFLPELDVRPLVALFRRIDGLFALTAA